MIDCIVADVSDVALVVDGDDYALILPEKYGELARTLADLLGPIETIGLAHPITEDVA